MSNKIDLHGIKHENVQKELDQFYWEMMQRGHSEVEVVTGISHIMKDIVKKVSEDYNFTVQEIPLNPGSLIVRIKYLEIFYSSRNRHCNISTHPSTFSSFF